MKGIIGTKVGMTQVFGADGERIPVTIVEASPLTVIAKMTPEKNKYSAVRVAFGAFPTAAEGKKPRWEKVRSKAENGVFTKLNQTPQKFVREIRLDAKELDAINVGDQIKVDMFSAGQVVDVVGTSKGHGFAGVMFRHNMAGTGAPQSHGAHEVHRHMGAVGQRKTPGRVYKGKRMPGHMGVVRITVQNLKVVSVDSENHLLAIKGAIPGPNGALVTVKPAVKTAARASNKPS